jgi:hemerythrin superfamily protein
MNVFQLLAKDHVKASTLINEICGTSNSEQRLSLYSQLKHDLTVHADAEEAHLYPVLKRHSETSNFVQEALDEHKKLKEILAKLDAASPEGSGFLDDMAELEKLLHHHAGEEEAEIFPIAERTLSKGESESIAKKIEAMKQSAATRV